MTRNSLHRMLTHAATIAALAAPALATTTQNTIMATNGSMGIAPNTLLLNEFGLSMTTAGNPAFGDRALLAMTVVEDQPYRMLAANVPTGLSLTFGAADGTQVQTGGLTLVAAEPLAGYDYMLVDSRTGQALFQVNGGSFNYDISTQGLQIEDAWLRATDELAARIHTPQAAGNLIASLSLKADMVVVRSEPFGGEGDPGSGLPQSGPGPRSGGDVVWLDIGDISHYGPVGTTHAYIFGTSTCNMGNQNISWLNFGTPGAAFNVFRLHGGRLMQIGQGFGKTACCAAAGSGCGIPCNGQGGSVLGAGCLDVYGSGWNAQQSRLMPRSAMNAYTGSFGAIPSGSGDAIWRRCQVAQADMSTATYPGALYFAEGVYVATEDAANNNRNNNASYRRATLDGSYNMTPVGSTTAQSPAIQAWRLHGLGLNMPDVRVTNSTIDIPNEGRFHAVTKVTDNGNGTWTYDYAIYNLSSDRAGGSLEVPIPANTNITNIGFHDVNSHSGEPFDNTDWVVDPVTTSVRWHSPQTFAQNANSNAIRWGTMYNFWFTADRAPANGLATLGLFKPNTPQTATFAAATPAGAVGHVGDLDDDGDVDIDDLARLLGNFGCTPSSPSLCVGDVNADGNTDISDLTLLLAHFGT